MVKEKLPCPQGPDCLGGCPICHGRQTIRSWRLALTADWLSPELVRSLGDRGLLPVGVVVEQAKPMHGCTAAVLRVDRHSLTEAIMLVCDALVSPRGEPPFIHRAW